VVENVKKCGRECKKCGRECKNCGRECKKCGRECKKCGRARQATDENIMRLMLIAGWITMATDTHLEYVILIAFPLQ